MYGTGRTGRHRHWRRARHWTRYRPRTGTPGADIVVAELDRANAERTAAEVQALGRRASVVPTDVTSRADLAVMVERTRAAFGRIDVLVNNAGIYRAALPLDITEEHWDAVMNINARAVFFASQAVLPTMIAQKRGAIVSLASMAGKVGSRTNLPYNASKAAVISITKSLALAHAADGIRVNCVCPGFVETDMWQLVSREQGACWASRLRISRSSAPPRCRSDVWSTQRTSPKSSAFSPLTGQDT